MSSTTKAPEEVPWPCQHCGKTLISSSTSSSFHLLVAAIFTATRTGWMICAWWNFGPAGQWWWKHSSHCWLDLQKDKCRYQTLVWPLSISFQCLKELLRAGGRHCSPNTSSNYPSFKTALNNCSYDTDQAKVLYQKILLAKRHNFPVCCLLPNQHAFFSFGAI